MWMPTGNGDKVKLSMTSKLDSNIFLNVDSKLNSDGIEPK